jgi:tRNA pseudouridine38-40 synthase
MNRIVLGIEYDGSDFQGWQRQTRPRTVQQVLEEALSKVANNQTIRVICAGRTDSGVHALAQVVHFDTAVTRELPAWLRGGNYFLPTDVRIIWANNAVDDFHARYSAIARFYQYVILNRPTKSALLPRQLTQCYQQLDVGKMHQAAISLIGHHDFSSFRAQGCQSKSPQRLMYFIKVYRQNEQVIIDLSANAFLHHMVRNIAGVLIAIGLGKKPIAWTQQLLAIKDRKQAGITAPPEGLYLVGVYYPQHYGIMQHPMLTKLPQETKRVH